MHCKQMVVTLVKVLLSCEPMSKPLTSLFVNDQQIQVSLEINKFFFCCSPMPKTPESVSNYIE